MAAFQGKTMNQGSFHIVKAPPMIGRGNRHVRIRMGAMLQPYFYRARNLVKRFFNKIKHCRRVATRYDKLAASCLAFFRLVSIRLWLRVNESASWRLWCPLRAYFARSCPSALSQFSMWKVLAILPSLMV